MQIERLKLEHFYDLKKLLDEVFTKHSGKPTAFDKLFPRIFGKANEYATSSHLGAFIDGKLVGTAAMYPLDYIIGGKRIRLIANGNVAVHEDYRGKGIMSAILNEINRCCDQNGDLGYLHGSAARYNRFGYFGGGIEYLLTFSSGGKSDYVFRQPNDTDAPLFLKLSQSRTDYIVRREEDFIPALCSGYREAVAVCQRNGELVGYLSLKRSTEEGISRVEEFAFAEKCETQIFTSLAYCLGGKVCVRVSGYDQATVKRCETSASISTSEPALFRIINREPLENAALSLGLSSDLLYAPYLT
jgi:predicted N-acetyltransferase YhbS